MCGAKMEPFHEQQNARSKGDNSDNGRGVLLAIR